MSVKIRLQRHGRRKAPLYHIVIADARAPRDGSFIERIGTYNPMTRPATIDIDRMKAYDWIKKGAQPTDTVRAILRFKGVLYYKHLQRGVAKGAMTPEEAEIKFRAWVDAKESRIAARVEATANERRERAAQISGTAKKVVKKAVDEEAGDELLNIELSAEAETADQPEAVAETAAEATPETEAPAAAEPEAPAEGESTEA